MSGSNTNSRRGRFPWVVLVVGGALFCFGLFQLLKTRYEVGDVYPPYSSLRSDPLGVMAFYESLGNLRDLEVSRDFSANDHLPEGRAITYLHLAGSPSQWSYLPTELEREVEGFLARGNRLVITFSPDAVVSSSTRASTMKKSRQTRDDSEPKPVSMKDKWGIDFGSMELPQSSGEEAPSIEVKNQTKLALPAKLTWHSPVTLKYLDETWSPIYARGSTAVMAERQVGAGTLVFSTDSYFLSNEALAGQRHAELLAWLVGPAHKVVFDEAHFGIVDTSGVAVLMRQYHLQWLAAGLLLLAALFIWKNSVSFIPPSAEEEISSGPVIGKQTTAGMTNLLRRNIAVRDLLGICFREWTRTLGKGRGYSLTRVDQAQAVVEREQARARVDQNPVAAYQEICQVLKGKP